MTKNTTRLRSAGTSIRLSLNLNLRMAEGKLAGLKSVTINEQDRQKSCFSYYCACVCDDLEKEYKVTDANGFELFTVVEDKDCCCRSCGGCFKADFNLYVRNQSTDVDNLAKIKAHRQFCSCLSCMQCCRGQVTVEDGKGTKLGTAVQRFTFFPCLPSFALKDGDGKDIFSIDDVANPCGRLCLCGAHSKYCCGVKCYVPSSRLIINGVGDVTGSTTELVHVEGRSGGNDQYLVNFPANATPSQKLMLIGATILIDDSITNETAPKPVKTAPVDQEMS
jgi:hypothetical protein